MLSASAGAVWEMAAATTGAAIAAQFALPTAIFHKSIDCRYCNKGNKSPLNYLAHLEVPADVEIIEISN